MNLDIIWSKGLLNKNEYSLKKTEAYSDNDTIINELKNTKKYLWIRLASRNKWTKKFDIDLVADNIHIITNDIILVTTDGDLSIPTQIKSTTLNTILDHSCITKWYTQNYDGTYIHPKLKPYPIGLDLHTNRWLIGQTPYNKIQYMLSIRDTTITQQKKIFSDVHLNANCRERKNLYKKLIDCAHTDFLVNCITTEDLYKKYREYIFSLSTRGCGLDCHRTWEIMFMGGIVITKTSSLDDLYINLPVVIVKDWKECLDKNNLDIWYNKYHHLTNKDYILKHFSYNYWLNR